MHRDELVDLLRWCAALSSEPTELAAEVIVAAGRRWPALADAPEDLRALTVQTFLRWSPTGPVAPDPHDQLVPELRPIAAALDKLPALPRVVIMLSCLDRLTRTEIAGILDRPMATVSREYDRAMLALGGDGYTVAATLESLSWQSPDSTDVDRAVRRVSRLHARRRSQLRLLAAALTAVLVAGVAIVIGNRPVPAARQEGVWAFASTFRPPPGWEVQRRIIGRDWETTILRASAAGSGRCLIAVGRAGLAAFTEMPQDAEPVRISGRPGFLSAGGWSGTPGPALAWQYAPDAWTTVQCSGALDPTQLLPDLARRLQFTTEPILLPYRILAPPRPYQVSWVVLGRVRNSTIVYLTRDDYPEGTLVISIHYPASPPMYGVRIDSAGVSRYKNGQHLGACKPLGDSHLCVRSEDPPARAGVSNRWHRRNFYQLDLVLKNLALVDSAADRSTWFDAREALPNG